MCGRENAQENSGCGCGCHGHGWRQYRTRDERREGLEEYREELRKELQAVEERIKELGDQA